MEESKRQKIILRILKKQIPLKANTIHQCYDICVSTCPRCEMTIAVFDIGDSSFVNKKGSRNFCSRCGQRIDWSEE